METGGRQADMSEKAAEGTEGGAKDPVQAPGWPLGETAARFVAMGIQREARGLRRAAEFTFGHDGRGRSRCAL